MVFKVNTIWLYFEDLIYMPTLNINMVKVDVTTSDMIHPDDTVQQKTVFSCENEKEFVELWEGRHQSPSSRKIKWSANITKLEIVAEEYIHYEKILFPPEKQEYVLTDDDIRMVKIHQIEEWMEANPQFHETENWPIVEYCLERMNVVDSGELFDNLLRLFIINTRDYEPACFYRGEEEE